MKLGAISAEQGAPLFDKVWLCESALERMRGLLGRKGLAPGAAMLLDPCGSVHTLGMRFTIDLLFLDSDWQVVRVHRDVTPGRWFVWGGIRARRVIELASGWLDLAPLMGQRLVFSASSHPAK